MAFNQVAADSVCAMLEDGKSLRAACKELELTPSHVLQWSKDNKDFAEQYMRAREVGYKLLADEIIDIADEKEVQVRYDGEDTTLDLSPTAIARNRLRVDTRKWMLSKMLPKIYGDKLDMNHGVQEDNPLAKLFEQLENTPLRPGK
jgi:hypothetical protein